MAPCLCCESHLLTWTKRSSYPCWHGGAEKALEEQAAFLVVSSGSIKPFFATRLDSVFYHSSLKGSVIFGTVPSGRLMLLYLKMEFVVVKKGNPVPSLWNLVVKIGGWIRGCLSGRRGMQLRSHWCSTAPASTLGPSGWGSQALLDQESRSMCGSCRGSSGLVP